MSETSTNSDTSEKIQALQDQVNNLEKKLESSLPKNNNIVNDIIKVVWNIFGMIAVVIILAGITYAYVTNDGIKINIDGFNLLSFALAFGSIGLSMALHYTSNQSSEKFQNEVNNFRRENTVFLQKIDSSFGEKLQHLKESYSIVRDRMMDLPSKDELTKIANEETDYVKEEYMNNVEKLLAEKQVSDNEKLDKMKIYFEEGIKKVREVEQETAQVIQYPKSLNRVKINNQRLKDYIENYEKGKMELEKKRMKIRRK